MRLFFEVSIMSPIYRNTDNHFDKSLLMSIESSAEDGRAFYGEITEEVNPIQKTMHQNTLVMRGSLEGVVKAYRDWLVHYPQVQIQMYNNTHTWLERSGVVKLLPKEFKDAQII